MSPSDNQFFVELISIVLHSKGWWNAIFIYHFNLLKIDSILVLLTGIVHNTFIFKKRKWRVNKNYYTIVFVHIVILIFKSIHNDQNYYNYRNNDHKYGYYSFYHTNVKVKKQFPKHYKLLRYLPSGSSSSSSSTGSSACSYGTASVRLLSSSISSSMRKHTKERWRNSRVKWETK